MNVEVNSILAHELKSPLALLRQLALSMDLDDDKALARTQSQMVSVSERALRQVNDLAKIARLEDGLFLMEPVSARAICDDVVQELAALFRYNQRDLAVHYRNRAKLVVANRELLYSVVYNFCLNAVHYSGVATSSELTVQDHHGNVRISVRDFGPALPTKIWRQLQRGWVEEPTAIAMRPGSSGLGLYIASKFSRYMHAQVGAIRHRDGTSFYVDLPISHQIALF